MGRLEEAADLYEKAAALAKEIGAGQLLAYILEELSRIQFRTGRHFQALATMHAGVESIPRPSLTQRMVKRLLRIPLNMLGTRFKE